GFWGLAMQQFMPRLMTERLPREVVFEQIPHLRTKLVESAERLRREMQSAARTATEVHTASAAHAAHGGTLPPSSTTVANLERADQSIPAIRRFLDEECLPYLRKKRRARHSLNDARVSDDTF